MFRARTVPRAHAGSGPGGLRSRRGCARQGAAGPRARRCGERGPCAGRAPGPGAGEGRGGRGVPAGSGAHAAAAARRAAGRPGWSPGTGVAGRARRARAGQADGGRAEPRGGSRGARGECRRAGRGRTFEHCSRGGRVGTGCRLTRSPPRPCPPSTPAPDTCPRPGRPRPGPACRQGRDPPRPTAPGRGTPSPRALLGPWVWGL